MSNLLTTIRSALPPVQLPTRSTWVGRLPRLPVTIFERTAVAGHQNLIRDHFAYCELATDRQQRVLLGFGGLGFSDRFISDVFCVLGSGSGCSFMFRPAHAPRSVAGLVWVIRPLYCGTRHGF